MYCVIILITPGRVSVVTSQEAEWEHLPLQEAAAPGDNGEQELGARGGHTLPPPVWPDH